MAEKWKLGTKDRDNGIVMLIAIGDRKMRIEVGQGLEGVITDAPRKSYYQERNGSKLQKRRL